MRRGTQALLLGWLLLAAPAAAENTDEYEKRLVEELQGRDPEAARLFAEGNAARAASRYADASRLYAQVEERLPDFVHATRRRCTMEGELGNRETALALCRRAVAAQPLPENRAALANALLHAGVESPPPGALEEARREIDQALATDPNLPFVQMIACDTAWMGRDLPALNRCSAHLVLIAPDSSSSHLYATLAALARGQLEEGQTHLDRAAALGLDPGLRATLQSAIDRNTPFWKRWTKPALLLVGGWLGGMVLLTLLGAVLSLVVLRAAARPPDAATGKATGLSGSLRRSYGAVLWAACAYYYVSLPLVILLVVAAGGGLIYGFFAVGRIPVKLVALIAVGVLITLWAVLKSLFVRMKEVDPGPELELPRHPKLAAVLQEVAGKVGTRVVDRVFLVPGTDVAVFERGGLLSQLRGRSERCLILGAGVLEGLETGPFKAILAHEYGHLSNEDTAGGEFALSVRRSLGSMAETLAANGAAAWYNPAWVFLNGFHRVFLRISQGASRLQEVLADRWAAFCYGAEAFEKGLRHVIERSIRFDLHAGATLKEVVEGSRGLANLYRYAPAATPDEDEVRKALQEAVERQPSPYDSHPAPAARFAWVHALPRTAATDDRTPVWDLFEDRESIERQMTDLVRANVAMNHGIAIAAADAAPAAPPAA